MIILVSLFAELAELLVQWEFVQFPDRINKVDILQCWFLSPPCVGRPSEVFRDRLTNARAISERASWKVFQVFERCKVAPEYARIFVFREVNHLMQSAGPLVDHALNLRMYPDELCQLLGVTVPHVHSHPTCSQGPRVLASDRTVSARASTT